MQGTVTLDKDWGGLSYEVHGLRVGHELEFFYSTRSGDTPTSSTATYSFKGTLDGDTMSGKCDVHLISTAGSSSHEMLWIAEKATASTTPTRSAASP